MKDFMLVFRSNVSSEEAFANQSPEEMQAEMEKWNSWMDTRTEKNYLAAKIDSLQMDMNNH
jgi:hypothetical protein